MSGRAGRKYRQRKRAKELNRAAHFARVWIACGFGEIEYSPYLLIGRREVEEFNAALRRIQT